MRPEERERLAEELLEYAYGCSENEHEIERRLAEDPDARALYEEVRQTADVLNRAARGPAMDLALAPPRTNDAPTTAAARAPLFGTPWRIAASIVFALFFIAPAAWWGVTEVNVNDVKDSALRLVVSGPAGLPDGAPGRFRVETWDLDGRPTAARVHWAAYGEDGTERLSGEERSTGAFDLELPATLAGVRRLEVRAGAGEGIERVAELELEPGRDGPLAHLASDKPAYRPGETVLLRGVLLQRLTLAPWQGSCRLRIVDPKGAPVTTWVETAEEGVVAPKWVVPYDAAGGEYAFELRDSKDELTFERLPVLVRRYQPPRLAKTVQLDQETYAPGESGAAEVAVERVEGGIPAGARVDGTLVVDGVEAWRETAKLDAAGRAVFRFDVPSEVERGEARFLARVTDGGVVETAVEPFVVPVGELSVEFYPEGGDLVRGLRNRVYAEVSDPLERPTSARGRVLDARGREVARFETEHQGRARFELEPDASREPYRLEFDEPVADPVELPRSVADGVVLRSLRDVALPGDSIALEVQTTADGPWIVGAFLRGVLVAQDTFRGAGEHTLELELDETQAGVLRVTVFDAKLSPVAERLVHRETSRSVEVAVTAVEESLLPGGHQVLDLVARDETGNPVSAVLGLAVTDRSVRDMVGDHRIGLADQTWLCADVEELEEVETFLAHDADSRRNVDLLLGTRGWRRFAWLDAGALVAEHGDRAKRLLLREVRPEVPQVADLAGDSYSLVANAESRARDARDAFGAIAIAGLVLLVLGAFARLIPRLPVARQHPRLSALSAVVLLVAVGLFTVRELGTRMAPGAELVAAFEFDGTGGPGGDFDWGLEAPGGAVLFANEPHVAWIQDFDVQIAQGAAEWRFNALEPGELIAAGGIIELDLNGFGAAEGDPLHDPRQWNAQGGQVVAGAEFFEYLGDDDDGDVAALLEDGANADGFFRGGFLVQNTPVRARVYAHQNMRDAGAPRTDFTETVYWHPSLETAIDGKARVEFDLSDAVTTWHVHVDAHGAGRVGQALGSFEAVPPFRLDAKLPIELTQGDRIELPIALAGDASLVSAHVLAEVRGPLTITGEADVEVPLVDGRGRVLLPIEVTGSGDGARIGLGGIVDGWTDRVGRELRVVPRGFPQRVSRSGKVQDSVEFEISLPDEWTEGSLAVDLKLYPSPLADLMEGVEGILQEPYGCFEQASSANYPNVLALAYAESSGTDAPAMVARARGLLDKGYAKIVGYECSEKGYEWFGGDPAHEALTAYGLLEFHDMAQVFDVDPEMLARTRAWVLSRRDGNGGYERNARALDSFGGAPQPITDAYVTYALAVTGEEPANIAGELDRIEERGLESEDPYEVALAAAALEAAERTAPADAARDRLKTLQQEDGSLVGTTTSITSSRGNDLAVETTSLAILAWLDDPDDEAYVERAVQYVLEQRSGSGRFGATQATIQALRALTAYAGENRRVANAGEVGVVVNDYPVESFAFEAGHRGAIAIEGLVEHLKPGHNRVRLDLTGGNEFPWALDVRYHAEKPADAADAALAITTTLASDTVEEGGTVALAVEVRNLTSDGLPMTLAVIGLPAGLEVPTKVLDDLLEAERFDLWELRGREVVLYWRDFAPDATRAVNLDLIARIPGTTTGPASRAYLYYSPDDVRWTDPLAVEVTAAR